MSRITLKTFEQAVGRYFEPIAKEHGWPLIRRGDNVYETTSPFFVMRIRFDIGAHTKGINATLVPTDQASRDIGSGGGGELGVGVLAGYNGVEIKYIPWEQTETGFFAEAQNVAEMMKTYGVPYLLGQKSDWNNVKDYIQGRIKERAKEIKQYEFPPNVQKRWHLPPPLGEDKKS